MDEAPIANPVTISLNAFHPSSASGEPRNARITIPMPSSPRLATARPITAPPLKATRSAISCPLARAASLVRALARVAACMPKNPARMEHTPPNRYAIAVDQPMTTPNRAATTIRKGIRYEYSRFRNAIAPVWIIS